jgi:predicted transcriptional regulator
MPVSATTSLKLDVETKERLQRLAATRRRSAHWLMREAIEQYIAREEAREQFRSDALTAWADYQATGQHVTEKEADRWLEQLEGGADAPPPKPHG